VSFVAAQTHPRRLAGSLAAGFGLHSHQLLFASGTLALGNALKGLATARSMLAASSSSSGSPGGQVPYNILMQVGGCCVLCVKSRAASVCIRCARLCFAGHWALAVCTVTAEGSQGLSGPEVGGGGKVL
jgi:hypothetical protein